MEDVEAVQQDLTAQTGGIGWVVGNTATASSKRKRPGKMLSCIATTKVVTWLQLPTKRSKTASTERILQSGLEEQIKREKEHGDGRTAAPGGSISGRLSLLGVGTQPDNGALNPMPENCLQLRHKELSGGNDDKWHDEQCSQPQKFVCSIKLCPPSTTSGTIVLI